MSRKTLSSRCRSGPSRMKYIASATYVSLKFGGGGGGGGGGGSSCSAENTILKNGNLLIS